MHRIVLEQLGNRYKLYYDRKMLTALRSSLARKNNSSVSRDLPGADDKTWYIQFLAAATSAAYLAHYYFFIIAERIRSIQKPISVDQVTAEIRPWLSQRDGLETYALYALVLLAIAFGYILFICQTRLSRLLGSKLGNLFSWLLSAVSIFSLYTAVRAVAPMTTYEGMSWQLVLSAAIVTISVAVIPYILLQNQRILAVLVTVVLIPVCLAGTAAISEYDYSYVFGPALKMIQGFNLDNIYFQYDILLSSVAAIWMRLSLDPNLFQIVGRSTFLIFFVALYLFAQRFFKSQRLAFLFIFAAVVGRIYALLHDPVLFFQVTPLRLDLWLILVGFASWKGVYSYWIGFTLALLIIFHRTFGLIYMISYLELCVILAFFAPTGRDMSLWQNVKGVVKQVFPNLVMIGAATIIGALFTGKTLEAALNYQSVGIGFLPIGVSSFYWWVLFGLVIISICLFYYRQQLEERYFQTVAFVIFLAVGNSIYFFGRSHEHNLLNISSILILVVFLLFDLLERTAKVTGWPSKFKQKIILSLPLFFIFLLLVSYWPRITSRMESQLYTISQKTWVFPAGYKQSIEGARQLTGGSDKVFFTGPNDFYYYYNGSYRYESYYAPYSSWLFKEELINHLQGLLDDEYYIISPRSDMDQPGNDDEIFAQLQYRSIREDFGFKVIWGSPARME